jgi:hypothetical protein
MCCPAGKRITPNELFTTAIDDDASVAMRFRVAINTSYVVFAIHPPRASRLGNEADRIYYSSNKNKDSMKQPIECFDFPLDGL